MKRIITVAIGIATLCAGALGIGGMASASKSPADDHVTAVVHKASVVAPVVTSTPTTVGTTQVPVPASPPISVVTPAPVTPSVVQAPAPVTTAPAVPPSTTTTTAPVAVPTDPGVTSVIPSCVVQWTYLATLHDGTTKTVTDAFQGDCNQAQQVAAGHPGSTVTQVTTPVVSGGPLPQSGAN